MNIDPTSGRSSLSATARPPQCAGCPASDLNLCHLLSSSAGEGPDTALPRWSERTILARQIICGDKDLQDDVPFLCEGWAAAGIVLPDGRRQILSFLLPGDIISSALLFEPRATQLVESITPVRLRTFKRAEVKSLIFARNDLMERVVRIWIEEKLQSNDLAVDLGRRMADARIARLVLELMARLERRGMMQGDWMPFPLRQHQIADATGLTIVHVNKTLTGFRNKNLIEIGRRSMIVLNPAELRRIAGMP
jgi:CRP/FNR family transcriptional regulator